MKNNKGITLIALVITIIVLLILVGVVIGFVMPGGIIDKAQESTKAYKLAEVKEKIAMELAALQIDVMTGEKEEIAKEELEQIIENCGGELQEDGETVKTDYGDFNLSDINDSGYLEGLTSVAELREEIDRLKQVIADLEKEKSDLSSQLSQKDTTIADLNKQLADKEKELEELRDQIGSGSGSEEEIADLQQQLQEKEQEISDLNQEVNDLNEEINNLNDQLGTKDTTIASLNETIDTLEKQVADLTEQINNANETIADLKEKQATGNVTADKVLSGYTFSNSNGKGTGTMTNRGNVSASINPGGSYTIPLGYHAGGGKVTANMPSGTATAAQVLTGYTFSNSSSLGINGSMPNRGALNWSGSNTTHSVPAGYYSGGTLDSRPSYNNGYSAGNTAGYNSGYSAGVNAATVTQGKLSVSGTVAAPESSSSITIPNGEKGIFVYVYASDNGNTEPYPTIAAGLSASEIGNAFSGRERDTQVTIRVYYYSNTSGSNKTVTVNSPRYDHTGSVVKIKIS